MTAISLTIRRWHAWAPGVTCKADWQAWYDAGCATLPTETADAPVPFVDAMLRRRLSPLSRVALHAAHGALSGDRAQQLIFASRHGELATSAHLLGQLARAEPLSPMGFSLSVHNTAAGLFGVAMNDPTPATAIAAGRDTLLACLTEAAAMRKSGVDSVLISYVEQAPPAIYRSWQEQEAPLLGLGLLIAEGDHAVQLRDADAVPMDSSPALSLISLLLGRVPPNIAGEQHGWSFGHG